MAINTGKELQSVSFCSFWIRFNTHRDSRAKLLEIIREFSKVARFKMNIHKRIAFLYSDTKYQEMEMGENLNNSNNIYKTYRDRCNNKVYLLIKLMDNFNEIPLESQQGLALFNWKNILSVLHGRIKFLRNAKKVPKEQ